jgi:hypothetical protein
MYIHRYLMQRVAPALAALQVLMFVDLVWLDVVV